MKIYCDGGQSCDDAQAAFDATYTFGKSVLQGEEAQHQVAHYMNHSPCENCSHGRRYHGDSCMVANCSCEDYDG